MKINFYKPSLVISIFHLFLVILVLLVIDESRLIWIWMLFNIIDFPISELVHVGRDYMIVSWGEPPYIDDEWKRYIYKNWPSYIFLILGTLWWYLVPIIIKNLFEILTSSTNIANK